MLHKVRWTSEKIGQRIALIEPHVYRQKQALPPFHYKTLSSPLEAPPVGEEFDPSSWDVIEPDSYWGTWETNFIMKSSFQIPTDWDKNLPVALYMPIGIARDFSHPEALSYIDGKPYATTDRHHHEFQLDNQWRDGKPHRLALHGWTGRGGFETGAPIGKLQMRECYVVLVDQPLRDFVALARVAHDVAAQLNDDDPVKGRLYNALDEAFKVIDTRFPLPSEGLYTSVPAAMKALKAGIDASGEPMDVDIIGIGHAHIDVAWLWTLGQTVRKSGRTFSTALRLMEQFPDYTFSQSQAQLYSYTEQYYPEIFAQIKERVKEGRWEPMGGTWVEPDCNAIGAESLARQFLLGRGYFHRHFGEDSDTPVLWLPDTFGYSWALPQLIKLAGMKYFITHKMSWNQYNQMPNQILWWQGLDGTKVLTHFLTTPSDWTYLPHATTYNAQVTADEIFGTWRNFRQKETYNELITAYGHGDGGGGPTREMIENVEILEDFPGAPRVRPGTVREFMDRIESEISDDLPVWNGEFYLEYHRGTYTSQARNKRNNRKSEFLLHDAEFVAALAALTTDYAYPHADTNKAWELICLNQFHDILPGSSINAVYKDSDKDYEAIRVLGESVRESAIQALAATLPANTSAIAVNATSFGGRRIGKLDGDITSGTHLVDASGSSLTAQAVKGGVLVEVNDLAPYSVAAISEASGVTDAPSSDLSISQADGATVLENALLRVEINAEGDVTRVYDKQAAREVLAAGETANKLLAFEDRPMNFDAWDIDIFYEDRTEKIEGVESITVVEQGPLRVGLEIKRRFQSSQINQTVYLYKDSRRLDFDTWVDWHEHHVLLKAAFPVDVMSPTATFDVQWGNVERPTHRNTSWDWARFETCAHKWADLSEGDYGVAVLNDCKYGYDIHDNVIRLTLLKSATSPDEHADEGEHFMTYSLMPHAGDWRDEVIPAAYDLNDPLILRRVSGGGKTASLESLVSVSAPNVVIETIKQAEDGNGIIVRLYEDQRRRGKFTLTTGFGIAQASICNLLEEAGDAVQAQGNSLQLDIKPYQIINLRLVPQV